MLPELAIRTGEVSEKLGRGRHTTRHVELFAMPNGAMIADTPGFSAFDAEQAGVILKDRLPYAFPEFAPYLEECRFTNCSHTGEKGCAVLEALARGRSRDPATTVICACIGRQSRSTLGASQSIIKQTGYDRRHTLFSVLRSHPAYVPI
jgi:hypothetical protein